VGQDGVCNVDLSYSLFLCKTYDLENVHVLKSDTEFTFSKPCIVTHTHTHTHVSRCALFLNKLFYLNYPLQLSNLMVLHQQFCTGSLQYLTVHLKRSLVADRIQKIQTSFSRISDAKINLEYRHLICQPFSLSFVKNLNGEFLVYKSHVWGRGWTRKF
jgi:hypothetical protein